MKESIYWQNRKMQLLALSRYRVLFHIPFVGTVYQSSHHKVTLANFNATQSKIFTDSPPKVENQPSVFYISLKMLTDSKNQTTRKKYLSQASGI